MLKQDWGKKDFKNKLKALKAEEKGEKLRRAIVRHQASKKNGKRKFTPEMTQLTRVKKKGKARRRRNIYKRLTQAGLVDHFKDAKHGGYGELQAAMEAEKYMKGQDPVDKAGI